MPFQKGHKSFITEESKKRLSLLLKEKWQNPEFRKGVIQKMKGGNSGSFKKGQSNWLGKKHKPETIIKLKESHIGLKGWWKNKPRMEMRNENHWNWKGGTTNLRQRIMVSYKYRQWRSDIFQRDNYTCQKCNQRGIYLEADHNPKLFSEIIKEYKIITVEEALLCEELWNINNGRTLCRKCHNLTKYGRRKI